VKYLPSSLRWMGAMLWLCALTATEASAQVYAPQPPAMLPSGATYGALPLAGGNPFVRRGVPRASLLDARFDDQVQPASFEQPLPTAPIPTPVPMPMPMTAPVAMTPPVAAPLPMAAPLPPAAPTLMFQSPDPQPMPPSPLQPPVAAPIAAPVAQQQNLRGVAMLTVPAAPGEHPLVPILRWSDDALQQMQGLNDYTCTFTKRERVDGRLQEQQAMYAKVRHQPYSVYLQFLAPVDVKGQEAMYVEGRNQGRLLAHPVGFKQALVGTLSLLPTDPQAMAGNLYPITDFGVRRLLERYRDALGREAQFGECNVRIVEGASVGDRSCTCIEVSHPTRRTEFRYHLTRLYVDNELNLPIHYESYDWPTQPGAPPQLVEDYTYQGLRPNAGLSDADFDEKNPNYRF
jgi:hypothetical protein